MPILQAKRYEDLLARRAEQAVQLGMDREFMRSVLQAIHRSRSASRCRCWANDGCYISVKYSAGTTQ